MEGKLSNPKIIKTKNGQFQLLDDDNHTLETRDAKRSLAILAPYFEDQTKRLLNKNLTYVQLLSLVKKLNHRLKRHGLPKVETSNKVNNFIKEKRYYIKEQSEAGLTIKNNDSRWKNEFSKFKNIVSEQITRPLKSEQEKASFYLAIMKRAANFSVPGAGKTAMMYGAFAFLSSKQENKVNKILVVCPLNAFTAWRTEFEAVFGPKRVLHYMNLRDYKYNRNIGAIKHDWIEANVIIINYESLQSKLRVINELLDKKTMLVFDEVHRVKNVRGQRARAALRLSKKPQYRYVLTGTPIPNGFIDIYNFLHLMYPDEYSSFFAWDFNDLKNIDTDSVNKKLAPFFWRTNKKDLQVPKPDPDKFVTVDPSKGQQVLAEAIYENENGALARFIRLLQASTNPALLRYNINYQDLGLVEADSNTWNTEFSKIEKENRSNTENYKKYDLENIDSPKFDAGIKLVKKLTAEGKKVLVWGMFIGTMEKIYSTLKQEGIQDILVYGATPKKDREKLINQVKYGNAQVLISNPNTLGESISLHQSIHDAVYFEYNFNLTFMLQSRDRINRLGLPPNQYTRYYYLMTDGDVAHSSFIDRVVYRRLKEKEQIMLNAIDGQMLVPEYTDDYLEEVKKIVLGEYK